MDSERHQQHFVASGLGKDVLGMGIDGACQPDLLIGQRHFFKAPGR